MAKKSYSNDRTMQNEWFSFVALTALIFFTYLLFCYDTLYLPTFDKTLCDATGIKQLLKMQL